MKNIKNIFYIGMLAICTISMGACSEEVTYDFPGDSYNHVYLQNNGATFMLVHTPISSISTLDFELPLYCNHRVTSAINAKVDVDNSLIAAYNEKNNTKYAEIPASSLAIENTVIRFEQGGFSSANKLHIQTNEAIGELRNADGYLIPVTIKSVEGNDCKIVENMATTYVIVNVKEDTDNIYDSPSESNITGTLVTDQTGWSATTNGTVQTSSSYKPIETLFDNDASTYSYIRATEDLNLDINMGKPYTFDAIRLLYSSWSYEYGSLANNMMVYTSKDGTTWESVGKITNGTSKFCMFYAPVTTQYIRIVKPKGTSSSVTLQAGVFNVYAK